MTRLFTTSLALFALACGSPAPGPGSTEPGRDQPGNPDVDAPPAPCDDVDQDGVCDDVDLCEGDDLTGDSDEDGVCDDLDPCTGADNVDSDGDGLCDAEDPCEGPVDDIDGDGFCDDVDTCVQLVNPDQADDCGVVFVDPAAAGEGTGETWRDAFTTLEAAIDAAQAREAEVWLAAAVYRPTEPRAVVLEVPPGVQVYGGFEGTESAFEQRDPTAFPAVLDGDHLGNDVPVGLATVAGGQEAPNNPSRADNAGPVVQMAIDTVLDGVTVQNGYSEVPRVGIGVAIPADTSGVLVENVVFRENLGAVVNANGAGIGLGNRSDATVRNSTFVDNIAWNGAGIVGAGGSFLEVDGCRFEGNGSIGGQGAGIRVTDAEIEIRNTEFIANELVGNAGVGFQAARATGRLENVLFDGNVGRQGALRVQANDAWELVNITVANHPSSGPAIVAGPGTTLLNGVFFGNGRDLSANPSEWPSSVSHTCLEGPLVEGDVELTGVISLDGSSPELDNPFVVGPDGELFLAHADAGDGVTSACVDAGRDVTAEDDFPEFDQRTTRIDGVLDGANGDAIDPGFHYLP